MRRKAIALLTAFIVLISAFPLYAFAEDSVDPPVLKSISFNNAVVDGKFSSSEFEYGIILDNPAVTPTLKSYEISRDAYIFVNYELDEAKRQTAVIVDVENDNIKTSYVFRYLNAKKYEKNSNCNLAYVECYLGEVYPELSEDNTDYSLYIPRDLTEITLSAAAQDVGAYCEVPGTQYINIDQAPVININVTSSDASTKIYTFKIKRLEKNIAQVKAQMTEPDFSSLVEGELFYQKTGFRFIIAFVFCGIIVLLVLMTVFRRAVIKAYDSDEKDFYDMD